MTSTASAHAREPQTAVEEYDEMEAVLDQLLDEALRKVSSGRVYNAENERVRIKWIRIAKDVVAEKRKVKADRELASLTEDVERLKEASGIE